MITSVISDILTKSDREGGDRPTLRFEVEFTPQRSVVLALIQPRVTEIPQPGKLAKLASNRKLLHLAVVDQVILCPSYALVVTGSTGGKVVVSFEAQGPPPDDSQQERGHSGKWVISSASSYERCASFNEAKCYGRLPFFFALYVAYSTHDGSHSQYCSG